MEKNKFKINGKNIKIYNVNLTRHNFLYIYKFIMNIKFYLIIYFLNKIMNN